jgi:multidrug resistance efflux pump
MSDSSPHEGGSGTAEPGVGTVSDIDHVTLRRLGEATTAEEFCTHWLELQARMIGGVSGAVVLLERAPGEPPVPVAAYPRGRRDLGGLAAVIERTLKERKGVLIRSDAAGTVGAEELRHLLAFPVLVADKVHGVAALEITPRAQTQLLAATRQLQWGIAWLHSWVLRQTAWPEAHLKHRLTTALEMAALVLEAKNFRSAASSFLTELATRLSCDRVSLGLLRRKVVKVQALSHSADFKKQMNLIRAIGSAMTESIDQQSVLVYPEPEGSESRLLRCHEELARAHGDAAICTIPFVNHEGSYFGALTLERSRQRPFDRATANVCDSVAALVGPILEERRRSDRPILVAAWESLVANTKKLFGPRHVVMKLIASGLAALVLFFSFATGLFRVTAKTTLEGEIRRVVTAPYRGFVFEAPVRAGDLIEAGSLMCRLDDRDLKLERTKWSTEREQYRLEHRKAMAGGDLASMKVLTKKMNQADAQLALLDEQMARSQIVAPFRGVVVNGDLSQSLGAPVDAGQVLFEVAPLDAYRLSLKVDEWDVSHVEPGQKGNLILTALPGTYLPFTVTRTTPVALAEEGRSYFKVEARLDEASDRVRPGMEGFAKIEVDRRKLIWIWTHDLIDWARLKVWSLWP